VCGLNEPSSSSNHETWLRERFLVLELVRVTSRPAKAAMVRAAVSLRGDLLGHQVVAAMLHVWFLIPSRIKEHFVQWIRGRG
jgi:hypothetical protein